jgi:hypothetical protein
MIIPSRDPFRHDKIIEIRDACMVSIETRRQLYSRRKKFFMFGSDDMREVRYNRLFSHTDLVSSFLYSPDHATFSLSGGINAPDAIARQSVALGDEWNEQFRDSGLAYSYGVALTWSLIFDSMFLKIGWNDARDQLAGRMLQPASFGVYDETEPDLDAQEAFVHVYRLPYDNAVLRLYRAGLKDRVKDIGVSVGTPIDDLPPVLKQLIISSTGGQNLTGNIMGQAPLDVMPMVRYEAQSDIPTVEFQELWVWDDITEDYCIFTLCDPDILLSDSRDTINALRDAKGGEKVHGVSESNTFLDQEHPFVPIIPYQLPDYFWGEAHSERLIPLQQWTTERLDQIAEILEQQVDPAKVFSGFMGLGDEKAGALGGPGTWVMDALPSAKVEKLDPKMPEDLFSEVKEIGAIFLEASGLTETVTGQGAKNVRGASQAKQLATTGSGRIKKVAINLEPSLVQCGDLGLKLFQRNSDEELIDAKGEKFLPAQYAADKWSLRIAGHSHSPLFMDESRELAQVLLKSQAIDREMFVRLLNPPQRDTIITQLRQRVLAEQQMAALHPEGIKPPGGKARQKGAHDGP